MTKGAPQTVRDELLDSIKTLRYKKEAIDPFTIRNLKHRAKTLSNIDAAGMWILYGMISVLENDPAEMRKCHENAIKLRPGDAEALSNYSVSLSLMGFHSESLKYHVMAYEKNQGDIHLLDYLINACVHSGQFKYGQKWISEWNKISKNTQNRNQKIIEEGSSFIQENNLCEDELLQLLEIYSATLREHKHWIFESFIGFKDDEYGEWLSYVYIVKDSIEKTVDISIENSDKLALRQDISSNILSKVVVRYESAESIVTENANNAS